MRRKIIIPEAGVSKVFPFTGKTLIVEQANEYENPEQVPLLGFDSGNNQNPIFPKSQYQHEGDGRFQRITVTGTEQSAGDELYLLSSNLCLGTKIEISFLGDFVSIYKDTFIKTASDAVQNLSVIEQQLDGSYPVAMYISVSHEASGENGINYAFGSDPVQGSEALGMYLSSEMGILEIKGLALIQMFNFIANTTGQAPKVNFTMEYNGV